MYRKIDDLGRIVIPMEIREKLFNQKDCEGIDMYINVQEDGSIILRPFYKALNVTYLKYKDYCFDENVKQVRFAYDITLWQTVKQFIDNVNIQEDVFQINAIDIIVDLYDGNRCRTTAVVSFDNSEEQVILLDATYNDFSIFSDIIKDESPEIYQRLQPSNSSTII